MTLLAAADFAVQQKPDRVIITDGGRPVAAYVFRDEKILRPYFAHAHAPGGIQVTRNHPPVPGVDAMDHDMLHPGVWLGFGKLSGQDFWRNKANIVHVRFVKAPAVKGGRVTFTAENKFQAVDGELVCRQTSGVTLLARPAGYLLIWEATFQPERRDLVFGDQEEMGLGIRVATPIAVKQGGVITDAAGRRNEPEVWGNGADWCDYSGTIAGRHAGITIMGDPRNIRQSRHHARNYGALVANPFGQQSFGKGPVSEVVVKPGESFRLRYGVLLHAGPPDAAPDLKAAFADFLSRL
ncbi:MAG: PmoA family protein [Bryobacteraceae bacterium]